MKKISVTSLAKLGKCERQAYLDYFYGDDHCAVRAAAQRGNSAHEEFARRLAGQDRRCFIASALFGAAAWQTEALRRWRDEWLLRFYLGRYLVKWYYRFSPRFLPLLAKRRWLRRSCAAVLECWIRVGRL